MQLAKEINKLKAHVLSLSEIVEDSVRKAVLSAAERNTLKAREVIDNDARIDQMEVDIEEECLKVLALHQPVAVDLRFVVTVLKVNNDLERIGDLAVNIAESALSLASHRNIAIPELLSEMMEKTRNMLHKSLDALIGADTILAHEVLSQDDEIDELDREMFALHKSQIRERPEWLDSHVCLITISHNLERIADLATNIAEDVIYLMEGDIVRHGHTWIPGLMLG